MINITDKAMCCGCNACGDICAKNAITFKTDIEGFWYPEVNKALCIECGLCEKVCPVINVDQLKKNDLPQSVCYAAEHKNMEVIFDSTSGGLFSALADIFYKDKGYVGGAIFNEDYKSVRQFISADKKDLPKLRSSKYLQSSLEGFYRQVRELVVKGENVLVCGSPCQMAALRAYLRKDYDNLIIADYICRGINSPKVWRKYIESYEERYGSKVVWAKAKSKEYGWRNLTQKVILEDGRHMYETKDQSNFTMGYLRTNAYCRPSCYECKFKGYPRMADITLADFWGIERIDKSMEKNLGTSLVMINSKKGEAFFERVKARIHYITVPFDSIEEGNKMLNRPLAPPRVDRKAFFEDLDKMTFTQMAEKYIINNSGPTTTKGKIKYLLERIKRPLRYMGSFALQTKMHPKPLWQTFRYNTLKGIFNGDVLLFTPHCCVNIHKGAKLNISGKSILGVKGRFKSSSLETRLHVERGGTLNIGPKTFIGYGAEIQVFKNATLTFKGSNGSNEGLTVICGDKIEFGKGVMFGHRVTVRDNNGGHYINRQGYKNSSPVYIGDKVWLCEQCTVMNGVKIGDGAIVGAKSFVIRNVPAHSMVSGHPAEIIDEDVLWKY